MRVVLTLVLAALFTAVACVLSLFDGVVRTVSNADAMLAVVDQAEARPALVDVAEELVVQELNRGGRPTDAPRAQLHVLVDSVLAKDWFDASLRRLHGSLRVAVDGSWASAVLDLHTTKRELDSILDELAHRILDACARLAGASECPAPVRSQVTGETRQARVQLFELNDRVDLVTAMGGARDQIQMRRWYGYVPQARGVAMGVMALLIALSAFVNLVPLRRLLFSSGLTLMVTAVVSLVAHSFVDQRLRGELEHRLLESQHWHATEPAVARLGAATTRRLTAALIDGSVRSARTPLVIMALAGGVLVASAAIVRRRN